MHRLKKLSKKIMAIILAAELIAAAGMVLDILYTVYLTQQNARLQKQAEAIAVDLVQNQIAGEVTGTAKRTKKTGADLIEKAYVRRIAKKAENLEYVPASTDTNIGASEVYDIVQSAYSYSGGRLSRSSGTASGPNGKETYYNLNMSGVVRTMRGMGNTDAYWESERIHCKNKFGFGHRLRYRRFCQPESDPDRCRHQLVMPGLLGRKKNVFRGNMYGVFTQGLFFSAII